MKKAIAGAIVAFMVSAGLVAGSGSSAVANDADNPYVGTVKTNVRTSGPFRVPNRSFGRVKVRVNAAGNFKARGTIQIVIRKRGKGKIRTKTAQYNGTPRTIRTGKLFGKGRYKVIVKYKPTPNSIWRKSRGIKLLRVV